MAPSPDPTPIKIKVSWLKQKLAPGTQDPILEFDEQQIFSFDPNQTTFKMVKHSCSYPAPPHKVRMWCSSFGASLDLPTSMELNVFINTFELIADEKHTLTMVSRRRTRRGLSPAGRRWRHHLARLPLRSLAGSAAPADTNPCLVCRLLCRAAHTRSAARTRSGRWRAPCVLGLTA
jgi:hypothetical protein